ncbi:hypothetical protein DWB85_10055 [Seongchinamella sediminis]|uniref:YhdP central domain-containing protein n=1 Tax=Seongchinamella sediminis TaxID=2283635 RepID=A0A3L7E1A8_9GAMM|nr:DUF3971 domain-containing protein [Seongchinamella sediminis]RLQ21922.1 hypothetical protein DWB85_10055 [Seongchinamella sediminis]
MQRSIFHKLSSFLWGLAVLAIVLLATYVSVGRLLSSNLQGWQDQVLDALNRRVPFQIHAQRISGEWHSFTPEILLDGLELVLPEREAVPLQLSGGRMGIDVSRSIATRSLQFTSLQLEGLTLVAELNAEGRLVIPGLTGSGGELGGWLQDFLLNIEYITLRDNKLRLLLPGGEQRDFALDLHLAREGSVRHLRADMLSTAGTDIHLTGRGLGNPFRPAEFEGVLFARLDAGDLGALSQVLSSQPALSASGRLDSEFWLTWDRGEAGLDMDFEIYDLLLEPADGEWSLPLDALSFQATLVQGRNHRSLFADNFSASLDDAEVNIPRLQLDAWGSSLRLRTGAVDLEPLNRILQSLPGMPATLQSVFATLAPRGELTALQLGVGDYTDPLAEWDVEGNFDRLQVDSWRGAPGVRSATGYFELSETGGYVVIDSQQFTMSFPTLYRQPLYYDDFFGTLGLSWDADGLLLHSGLITASGVEGTAQALFSLNIPFHSTEAGLEMDLMVGLASSHPIHRVKYIPYTLNQNLLDWLSTAVGEGEVEQAGFIWRGSLKRGAADLRTVQLMLNVDNTSLAYHPDWPPVSAVRGAVLLDDTDVSVWADSAKLYSSTVERLSAEAWMDEEGQMRLAIDGWVVGSAEDGLRAVNDSLLGRLTREAFADWRASGELETELQLELNLADSSEAPVVDVSVDLQQVDLEINPGRLAVDDLSGELSYDSRRGFRSRDIQGELWGEAVRLEIGQRSLLGEDAGFDFGQSAVEIDLAGTVEARALQGWLQQDALALAAGRAEVSGKIAVLPGELPLLTLQSSLQGMALDLPQPWTKSREQAVPLEVALPLGPEQMVLGLALGEALSLQLDITGGSLQGGALGVNTHPPGLLDGQLQVAGTAPLVDVDGWLAFTRQYLLPAADAAPDPNDPPAPAGSPAAPGGEGLRLVIDQAHAERLLLWGSEYADARFKLSLDASGWEVEGGIERLQGSYRQDTDGSGARLDLDYLDLSPAVSEGTAAEKAAARPGALQLPPIDVRVSELRRNGRAIGQLQLVLESAGGALRARGIVGEVAGLELLPEPAAELVWTPGQGTTLQARPRFADFGDTLEQLGYARFLETETGRLELELDWPGPPQAVSLAGLGGRVGVDVGAGRFLQTPAAAGALQVVEIVNLADIVSSLSLSHMFESGINFHNMDGEILFHGGNLEVAELTVKGSSSAFSMSGVSDIASRSLDGELVATLPVANNLPWVAALAGGLPVAAGVFVVSKVFEKQVNRLSSGVYTIQGTWDDPLVKFDRIFDDEVRLSNGENLPEAPNSAAPPAQPGAAQPEAP